MRDPHAPRLAMALMIAGLAGSVLFSNSTAAQILPPARPAMHVKITQGPALEIVKNNMAIIRWTSNNPGGSDEHYGVVHYGTDPGHLSETAESHIRLNQNHRYTVFRVRVDGLKPHTTYYYTVASKQADGKIDPVKSPVNHFSNP